MKIKKIEESENYICIGGSKYPILSVPETILMESIDCSVNKDISFSVLADDYYDIIIKFNEKMEELVDNNYIKKSKVLELQEKINELEKSKFTDSKYYLRMVNILINNILNENEV